MTPEQTLSVISAGLGLLSIVIAVLSAIAAWNAAKHARQSVTTTILLELYKVYSSDEMNNAVSYIHKLKREHSAEFSTNPYRFARTYVASTATNSPEWNKRRMISHFYNNLANLIDRGLIAQNAVSALWAEQDLAIIEILEPIETAIVESLGLLPYGLEWPPLRLLNDARHRSRSRRRWWRRMNPHFTLPSNAKLYAASLPNSTPTSDKAIPANPGNHREHKESSH